MKGIILASAVTALGLGGCATVVEGTSQSMAIQTTPPGASCTVSRQGAQIGAVLSTPGSVRIDKSKNDLSVTCNKEGYQAATQSYASKFNGTTFGNILLGGVAGAVIDASTGASYNYPTEVTLPMLSAVAVAPAPATPVAAAVAPAAAPVAAAPAAHAHAAKPATAKATVAVAPAQPAEAAAPATQTASNGVIAPDPLTRTMKPVD